jgi:hypothetical protein
VALHLRAGEACGAQVPVGDRGASLDVNFETGLMTVSSPKTEHHADGAVRQVPMSPKLQEILLDAHTAAEPGAG